MGRIFFEVVLIIVGGARLGNYSILLFIKIVVGKGINIAPVDTENGNQFACIREICPFQWDPGGKAVFHIKR